MKKVLPKFLSCLSANSLSYNSSRTLLSLFFLHSAYLSNRKQTLPIVCNILEIVFDWLTAVSCFQCTGPLFELLCSRSNPLLSTMVAISVISGPFSQPFFLASFLMARQNGESICCLILGGMSAAAAKHLTLAVLKTRSRSLVSVQA